MFAYVILSKQLSRILFEGYPMIQNLFYLINCDMKFRRYLETSEEEGDIV